MLVDERSVLPERLCAALRGAEEALARGIVEPANVAILTGMIAELPLRHLARAISEIRIRAWLYLRSEIIRSSPWPLRLLRFGQSARTRSDLLARTPKLEYLFLFHGSGYLRQAALDKLDGPLPGPFYVGAIVHRLNDWVPEVRRAARACLARTAPVTDPGFIATAALHLLVRTESWRRWQSGAQPFDDLLTAPDVARRLAEAIATSAVGPMGRTLRAALRDPALDPHLPDLLRNARQPSVRAVVLKTLLDERARWPGTEIEKRWIDKSLGQFRYERIWRERPLERPLPLRALLEIGAADRAASVRKVAASGLIAHFDAIPDARALAGHLLQDRSRPVRERASFALARAGSPA